MTRTRIVATLGPATNTSEKIRALIEAGVDVFRLNFSHGTHEAHGELIKGIRRIAGDRPIAILQDLCGPKLRLTKPVKGKPGEIVEVDLPPSVKKGDPVLLADGIMHLEVVDAKHSRVIVGGDTPSGKGINLPSSDLDIPSLTDKDKIDLEFGVKNAVDYIALSFVRRAERPGRGEEERHPGGRQDREARGGASASRRSSTRRRRHGRPRRPRRGDPHRAQVPVVQKRVIALANARGRRRSSPRRRCSSRWSDSPRPTRAEATRRGQRGARRHRRGDADGETAAGNYPIESVKVMDRILAEVEPLLVPRADLLSPDPADAIAQAACILSERVGARAIVVPTSTGYTAKKIASYRPRIPILVLTNSELVRRRLSLVWGVTALPRRGSTRPPPSSSASASP